MEIHVVGNKGVVGSATEQALKLAGIHQVTGSDKDEEMIESDITLLCTPEKITWDIINNTIFDSELVVIRSTMRPDLILEFKRKNPSSHFCVNPEFLKAHTSFWDCYFPKVILIGECCKEHGDMVEEMWKFTRVPIYRVSQEEASMIKLSSNVYAAMLITFWNNLKPVCDKLDLNINDIARILPDIDERVSRYGTIPGSAYGGTCLPKDMKQLIAMCKDNNVSSDFLDSIERVNSLYSKSTISRGGL